MGLGQGRSYYAVFTKMLVVTVSAMVMFAGVGVKVAKAAVPEKIKIGVVASQGRAAYKNAATVTFTATGSYRVLDTAALPGTDLIGEIKDGSEWQVAYLTTGIQVIIDGQPQRITTGPVAVREIRHSDADLVKLISYVANGSSKETTINKRYRGDMIFRINNGCLTGVNELPMDEYIYGVVPREMSNSWPIEALKAQALAARTYATANYGKRVAYGYDLLDTPDDQAYGGYNSEGAQATLAVQQTNGKIITFDGKPISAVYHSNSGGYTENNENVWDGTAISYLRAKADPYSLKCKFGTWSYDTVATGTDAKGRTGVQEKLKQIDSKFGTLATIQLSKYPSGRVKKVVISDTTGYTIEKSGSDFGKLFNPSFYTYLDESSFMSNFFDVSMGNAGSISITDASGKVSTVTGVGGMVAVNDDGSVSNLSNGGASFFGIGADGVSNTNVTPQNVVFTGHGWGHGVGMSQWGAYQMAKEGKSYQQIIEFYYTGVTVE